MKHILWRVALGLIVAGPVAAQTPASVAGTYEIEYPVRMMINGSDGGSEIAKVKLMLEVKGDSVVGTWQMSGPREVPAQTLRGTRQGNTVKLNGSGTARIRGNGEERQVTMQQEYAITIDGDKLTGTVVVIPAADGMQINVPPRPFTGKRVTP